jgi:rRNA maturation RNase YbeY
LIAAHEIVVANRQRAKPLDRAQLKKLVEWVCAQMKIESAQVGFHFVTPKEMARVHEQFMNIAGSTDVITFDHGSQPPHFIHGEIYISIADAIQQAKDFKTTWRSEVNRYVIHGLLHLLGYDDTMPKARAIMKRHENRLLKKWTSARME